MTPIIIKITGNKTESLYHKRKKDFESTLFEAIHQSFEIGSACILAALKNTDIYLIVWNKKFKSTPFLGGDPYKLISLYVSKVTSVFTKELGGIKNLKDPLFYGNYFYLDSTFLNEFLEDLNPDYIIYKKDELVNTNELKKNMFDWVGSGYVTRKVTAIEHYKKGEAYYA